MVRRTGPKKALRRPSQPKAASASCPLPSTPSPRAGSSPSPTAAPPLDLNRRKPADLGRRRDLAYHSDADAARRNAYYLVLQKDDSFRSALDALYGQICEAAHYWPSHEATATVTPYDGAVGEFCERWLPQRPPGAAIRDVWQACHRKDMGYPLVLQAGAFAPQRGTGTVMRLPSRFRNPEDLYRRAWRLYMRVLHGQTSTAIAHAEQRHWGVYVSSAAVRSSNLEWSINLGIPLPEVKGRPPKA